MKLSDAAVRNARANGKVQKLSDGGGLYLHVTATGSKLPTDLRASRSC